MRQNAQRSRLGAVVMLAFLLGTTGPALSDQPPDHHGRIVVEMVSATAAARGARSIVRFRITNESRERTHLLAVVTPVATDAQIVGRTSDDATTRLESVALRADSILDLTTDHLWIELGPLTREIKLGESIPLELVFVRNRIRADAHVHSSGAVRPKEVDRHQGSSRNRSSTMTKAAGSAS